MAHRASTAHEPLIHLSKRSDILPGKAWGIRLLSIALALIVCGLAAFILIDRLREHPEEIGKFYSAFIRGSFSSSYRFWKFVKDLAILLAIALALTPAFRMRFWNIGAEGQTLMGALGAIAVNFYLGGMLDADGKQLVPNGVLLILMLLAALLAGAVWAVIPALFKARWNTNETLFTLMMNYVATYTVTCALAAWVKSGSGNLPKLETGRLPVLRIPGMDSDYFLIILVVLLVTVALYIYLNYSKQGYEISVVGESTRTAQYVGISVPKVIIRTLLLGGALCGLAGYLFAAGLDHSITKDTVGGKGFTAILVAWLGKFNPFAMIISAGLIQVLHQGAEQLSTDFFLRSAFPEVFVGIILFFVIGSEFFINYEVRFRGAARPAKQEEGIK